jgi:formylglycine-generating enzyme required for sulfatase activity
VERVSWVVVQKFVGTLQEGEKATGNWLYRLPTEEEWEYACRGGARSQEGCAFHFYFDRPTNDLSSDQANFNGDHPDGQGRKAAYLGHTTKVGSYQPNRLGIHDLHGNVWEWTDSVRGSDRVVRGGGWSEGGALCRAAVRGWYAPTSRRTYLGFRLALSPSGLKGG